MPLLATIVLVACATAPTRMLIALPPSAAPARLTPIGGASSPPAVLLVRRLAIPEYMAAPRVRYWSGAATLAEWPDAYWAERIEIGMAREFVSAMRRRLPGWTVCDGTCGDARPDITLKVDVLRLDTVRREQLLSASAQAGLSGPQAATGVSPEPPRAWSFTIAMSSDTAQGQAQAMSDLLGALADESVAAIHHASVR